jgi:hypothetical protein
MKQSKFPEAVLSIYEKHLGRESAAEVQERGIQNPFNRADRRRPQAVVHEKIAGEPEPVAELPANKAR